MPPLFIAVKICLVFSICLTATIHAAFAQSDHGLITYKLGIDTTVSQYFAFNSRTFSTTILFTTGQIQKLEAVGELDEKGDINKVESKTFRLDSTGNWHLVSSGTNIFRGDSTEYTSIANGNVVFRRAIRAKGIVSNSADAASFYVFPYMGFFAPAKPGDTSFHCQLSFGECRRYEVTRIAKNEVKIGSNVMGRIKLFVDDKGRVASIDAIGSSLNFTADVERGKNDYTSYINEFAVRRFTAGQFAPRTSRDTAVAISNNQRIEVDYWKPLRRNRTIFGAVVPYNRIWRMGANNATQLRTAADLNINGTRIPAGKYSLWIYPTETSWQLIINRKSDVWGTEYDASADLVKVPMMVEKLSQLVEALKITLLPQGSNVVKLQLEWEYQKAAVTFSVL